jgi:hypothetical protein
VTVPAPEGAEFDDLDGLRDGEHHLTWTAGPDAFFMVSAGTGPGYTPEGVKGDVDSDAPAPLAGPGARRIASRETKHLPERIETGGRRHLERRFELLSDVLFVPGEHLNLRIGYRVPEDASQPLRALLARMLDGVEVRRRDA